MSSKILQKKSHNEKKTAKRSKEKVENLSPLTTYGRFVNILFRGVEMNDDADADAACRD